MKTATLAVLQQTLDALKQANSTSMRENGWSTVPEVNLFADYVGLKRVTEADLDTLVKKDIAARKIVNRTKYYRVGGGGLLTWNQLPAEPVQDDIPGQDGKPPPDQGDGQNLRGGGAPGGVAIPIPVSGVAESVVKQIM